MPTFDKNHPKITYAKKGRIIVIEQTKTHGMIIFYLSNAKMTINVWKYIGGSTTI